MAELMVPAASPLAVRAAVESGAAALCVIPQGLGREKAQQAQEQEDKFTVTSFHASMVYCRVRGIKTYLSLENAPLDRDMELMEKIVRLACRCDMAGVVVSDLGLVRMVRTVAPEMKVLAGLQMNIHNAHGVHFLKEQGFDGVFLAPEMTREQIILLRRTVSGIDLIVTVHGRVCTAYGGTCRLTEMLHPDTGTEYTCGRVCEMRHGYGSQATDYPLTMKERCLAAEMRELESIDVAGYYIADQEADPAYIAAVTSVYSDIIKNPTSGKKYLDLLRRISSRGGVTAGSYKGLWDKTEFGLVTEVAGKGEDYLKTALEDAKTRPRQCVPVRFAAIIRRGMKSIMAVQDEDGNMFKVHGDMPARDSKSPLIPARVKTQLYKLEGTPYYCTGAKVLVDEGLMLPNEEINRMRDELLDMLTQARSRIEPKKEGQLPPAINYVGEKGHLNFTVSVALASQLTIEMLEMKPAVIYVPLKEAAENIIRLKNYIRAQDTELCVTFPAASGDDELQELRNQLFIVKKAGVKSVQVENVGQIAMAKMAGFETVRGGLGIKVRNSQTLKELKSLGLDSACISFTVSLKDIGAMSKTMDTELVAYGRVPLMYTRSCLIKNKSGLCSCESENHIVDDKANVYPLQKSFGCRNVMFSAEKIFLGGLGARLRQTGVWGARLNFTTENPRECLLVMQRYIKGGSYEPNAWGTGLYLVDDEAKTEKKGFAERLWEKKFWGKK